MGTRTTNFGTGKRESHDSSGFYARFGAPVLTSSDSSLAPVGAVDWSGCVLGDARSMSALPDASVALVVTSPPYFAGKAYEEAMGEGSVPADYVSFLAMLRDVFAECVRVLEPGGRLAVNVANLGRKPYRSLAADVIGLLQDDLGLLLRGEVVWVKASGASGSCAWGSFLSPSNPTLRDVSERVVIASKGRFSRALPAAERRAAGRPSVATSSRDEFLDATLDVWRIPPESARRVGHPAPFPVELPERLIHLYTYEGDVVLDPFCGSGSTLVAAARTGRVGGGYDTDASYVDAANARVAGLSALPVSAHTARASVESVAVESLTSAGFTITGSDVRLKGLGITVDLVARDPSGRDWYVDLSGGFTVTASGLVRMDGVWRSLGRAALLRAQGLGPVLLLTSHLPSPGTEAALALAAAGPLFAAALEVGADDTVARLAELAASP
ncbi:MAG: modification methylase [Actinomycetota bacterium]|nr:modification methylase [Actinomycetota bacterium]